MTAEELYRSAKNQIRRLAHRESLYVIWAYCQFLQVRDFRLPNTIQAADQFLNARVRRTILSEWALEQIAREVIRYSDETPRQGRTLRQWDTLAQIANIFHDIEDQIYMQDTGRGFGPEFTRITHRQFIWQQHRFDWRWIIRYYKLFNTPAITAHAVDSVGLSIEEIYVIGMAYLGIFFGEARAVREINIQIPGIERRHIEAFLAFTCLSRRELADRLRAEHALDEGFAYRYSSLRAFPLVQTSHRGVLEIACPIPTLLFWRITTGLYYALKDQPGFPTAFGATFQNYVGEVLRSRMVGEGTAVLPEAEYHVNRNRKDTVDWIVCQGDEAAMFVECKTMRLTWASKAGLSDLSALDQDIRKLAGAVLQVYKTIRDYRSGCYPQMAFSEERRIYPIIVTLEDWYFFGLDLPVRLHTAVSTAMEAAGLPIAWLNEMPFSVLSLDEFETATGVISEVGIHPFISTKTTDPELSRWGYGPYCQDHFAEIVGALPQLFHAEYEALFANLA